MIALDTNVLIYCCDKRDARRQRICTPTDPVAFTVVTLALIASA